MRNMLMKEWKLALHPTNLLFLILSAMLLIPNYPYYVIFFYSGLGLFFTCLNGRENHDIEYTLMLPVKKRQLVKGRYAFAVSLEMLQILSAVPWMVLRSILLPQGNIVGMDANIAFLGLGLILLGIFNILFFGAYYRAPEKVGKAFLTASMGMFLGIMILETAAHIVPFFVNHLDTPDPQHLLCKLAVLAAGTAGYVGMTGFSMAQSIRRFEKLDL